MTSSMPWLRPTEDDEEPGTGPTLQEAIAHLSPTKIDMFQRCPMQIEWRYVKGIKAPPAIALVEGGKYHETAAYRNEKIKANKKVTRVEMLEHFEDNFKDLLDKGGRKDIEWGDETEDSIFKRADGMIKVLHDDLAPIGKPSRVEDKFEMEVLDGVPVVAIADLVDGGGVADYKITGKKKSQGDADSSLQLSMYALRYGVKKVRIDNLVKTNGGAANRLYSTRSEGDFKWLRTVAQRVWNAMIAGNFPPCDPTSWVCSVKYCGWYSMCRGACYGGKK